MSQAAAVQKIEPRQEVAAVTPMDMLDRAVQSGANIEVLEKLMGLQERWEKNQARKAFDEAIAAAKGEIPPVVKNREVDFTSQKGRTHYRHEDMAEIARTVDPILAKHGLSYRYRATSNVNEPISVTCILSHRLGHFEETTLTGGRDETGNKNSLQGIGSTITYLQRYSLKTALGLAASNDDDGKVAGAGTAISADDAQTIRDMIAATKDPNVEGRLLKWAKVERIEDIPANRYDQAVENLQKVKRP